MRHKVRLIPIVLFLSLLFIQLLCEQTKAYAAAFQISCQSFTLSVNHYKTLRITGTNRKVIWSSVNKSVATVSSTGRVTAIAPGTVTICAAVSGKKLFSKVTVIKLSRSSAKVEAGKSITLKVYGTSKPVIWSSGNKTIATVSSTGKVKGKAPGKATIYASVSGKKLSCSIKVLKSTQTVEEKAYITSLATSDEPTAKIIGYYASWSRYSGFTPDQLDALKLTHMNYAFANISSDLKISLGFPDIDELNINGLNELKRKNPKLKTIISVGGYSWSGRFSDVALTEASRTIFADSCVDFIVKYDFDGIDIDWEYPGVGGLSTNIKRPEDKYNFTLLMKTLREKLDARGLIEGKKYILSFAGAAGFWYLRNIELNTVSQYIDYVNVMTYDLHGTWEPYTDFNAPLYSDDPLRPDNISVDKSINCWLNTGFPESKLIVGVPFYGFIFKAVANVNNGLKQTYSGGSSISYYNIAVNYLNAVGFQSYFNSYSRVPWLFNGSTFITYENEQSIAEKARYVKDKRLGGIMIWELSQDPNQILLNSLYQEMKR